VCVLGQMLRWDRAAVGHTGRDGRGRDGRRSDGPSRSEGARIVLLCIMAQSIHCIMYYTVLLLIQYCICIMYCPTLLYYTAVFLDLLMEKIL